MRLVLIDFDKTLTLVDSSLAASLYLFLTGRPQFLLGYLLLYFFGSDSKNFEFKQKISYILSKNSLPDWVYKLNTNPRTLAFLRRVAAITPSSNVFVLSGAPEIQIFRYLQSNNVNSTTLNVVGLNQLFLYSLNLFDSKCLFIKSGLPVESFKSIVFVNDSIYEISNIDKRLSRSLVKVRVL